jgi:hypothetical protein
MVYRGVGKVCLIFVGKLVHNSAGRSWLNLLLGTVIFQYTSNRFTSVRLYEMHKLIPVFQFTSQFSLIRAPSSRKPIVVPGASSREVMGN